MIINISIILILTALSVPYTPWYIAAVIALAVGFIRPGRKSFVSGMLGVGLAWLGYILYFHFRNDGIITQKIASIFSESLGSWVNAPILILVSVIIGSITGGLGSMSGSLLNAAFQSNTNKVKRNKKTYKLKIQ